MPKQDFYFIKYTITQLLNIQKAERSEIASNYGRKQNKKNAISAECFRNEKNPIKYR